MNASYTVSYDRDWTWIKFPGGKPAESILAALRSFARFSNRRVAWYITGRLDESDIARRLSVSTPEPEVPASEMVIDLPAQDVTPATAGKIRAVKFELYRAEGPIDDSDNTATVNTWTEADNVLKHWALTAPEPGHGYDKCDFKITYADGETYEGRYDLKQHDTQFPELIAYHIRGFQEFYAGTRRPDWMSEEKYAKLMEDEYSQEAVNFLAKYEIGESDTPAPVLPQLPAPVAPAPATEAERARAWFDAIDLEAIPADDVVKAEFWKNSVTVFHYKEPMYNGSRFSLYTRNPQQKQHACTATRRGNGNTLDDLRDGFEHFISEMEAKQARADARRDAKRQARASFVNPYKVGDFLYSSWGYDQTNREFYQVMEVRPASLLLREVAQGRKDTGYDSWNCWPLKDKFIKPAQWVTIQIGENGSHGVPSPIHGGLYLWDGKPLYASDGH